LLQRTVKHKFNASEIYAYDVDETALPTYFNNPEKLYGELRNRGFCQFGVRKEKPLQQQSVVSALLVAVHFLW
jgi:hypothetical protein